MTVLYIDDDPDDIEIFCAVLATINPEHTCLFADNALGAIELLKTIPVLPSIVVVDLSMLRMDGIECLEKIRNTERLVALPVIVVSSSTHASLLEKIAGLRGTYMEKPAGFQLYVNALQKKLNELGLP